MNLRSVMLTTSFLLFSITLAHAQKESFEIDPGKSQVQFSLEATMHAVHGTFHIEKGAMTFAPANGEMNGSIVVDAHSGNSGEDSRDKKMTKDQLKADQFATVTFMPRSFTGQLTPEGDSNIVVQGTFTLLGTPHDLSVPMHVHIDHGACTATGTFTVPFTKWGVKDPSTFMLKVGKEVLVNLSLAGSISPASGQ